MRDNSDHPAPYQQAFNCAGSCVERLRIKRTEAFIDKEAIDLCGPAAVHSFSSRPPSSEDLITTEFRIDTVAPMSPTALTSVAHRRRLERARAWLESRGQSEELLVVGATLDGANELARAVAKDRRDRKEYVVFPSSEVRRRRDVKRASKVFATSALVREIKANRQHGNVC